MYITYQNRICLPAQSLIEVGIISSINTYSSLCKRGHLKVIRPGGNGREALVDVMDMRPDIRERVERILGSPDDIAKLKLEGFIEWSKEAQSFYEEYRYNEDTPLPEETILEYTITANILNAIHHLVTREFTRIKITKGEMWSNIAAACQNLDVQQYPHRLPANPRRLQAKYRDYQRDGYKSIVHKGFGNEFTAKLTAEAKRWVLARWCNQVNRCASYAQMHAEYNEIAPEMGWKPIKEERTFYNYLAGCEYQWLGHRLGSNAVEARYGYRHSTKMASVRDALWYSDGTKLNLHYKERVTDKNGRSKWVLKSAWIYEVMDAFSEVFLGYHISKDPEGFVHQYNAFKMAVQTAGHRPYEVRFDNQGGHKKMIASEFMEKITRLAIRTQPYNGSSKSIESAFNRFQNKFLKRYWNYTGQNVTTKTDASKTNLEYIQANMANVPTFEELAELYPQIREEWNNDIHHLSGKTRLQTYLDSHNEKSPEIDIWDMVNIFWVWHTQYGKPRAITYTPSGIAFEISKQQFEYVVYDESGIPDLDFINENTDEKFYIKYDPDLMDEVYLYRKDHGGERFVAVAKPKIEISRAIYDQTEADVRFIKAVDRAKKEQRIKRHEFAEKLLEEFNMTSWQQGMNPMKIAGLNTGASATQVKKKKPAKTAAPAEADHNKQISNLTQNDIYDQF